MRLCSCKRSIYASGEEAGKGFQVEGSKCLIGVVHYRASSFPEALPLIAQKHMTTGYWQTHARRQFASETDIFR